MSTRCQVIIKDNHNELWFYRHSDGYPEGTMPTLEKFLNYVKEGIIRDNVEQAGGWLILFGAMEYGINTEFVKGKWVDTPKTLDELFTPKGGISGWKCGAFEPSVPQEHGDIRYLYTIDLVKKTITHVQR